MIFLIVFATMMAHECQHNIFSTNTYGCHNTKLSASTNAYGCITTTFIIDKCLLVSLYTIYYIDKRIWGVDIISISSTNTYGCRC